MHRFTEPTGEPDHDDDHSTPFADEEESERERAPGIDLGGIVGIFFALAGWALIVLGVPLLAALGAGIVVMFAGSCVCLAGLVPSAWSRNPARRLIALMLNGAGAIPAAFVFLGRILNDLFPV